MKQFNFTFFYSGSFLLLVFLLLAACSSDDDDTTAPAEVSNLQATANDGFVDLQWTPPSDTDLEYIYLNYSPGGSLQTLEKTATSATVSDLTNGTEYSFTLQTEDMDGNRSTGTQIQARPLAAQLLVEDFNTRCDLAFMEEPDFDPCVIFSNAPEGDDAQWACVLNIASSSDEGTNYRIGLENIGYEDMFFGLSYDPAPGDDWLILPEVDIPEDTLYTLYFSYSIVYSDLEGYGLKLKASTDYSGSGDPSGATWTELENAIDHTPQDVMDNELRTTEVSLSDWADSSVYFAFHYTSSGNTTQTSYQIGLDDVAIRLED